MSGLLLLGLLSTQPRQAEAQGQALTFGLIGDLAFNPAEEPLLQNVLDDLNNNSLAFVVHLGDLSSPRFACTDELLARRLAQFRASAHPFVFTPGDNDWTDFHSGQNVAGADPLDRLAKVRAMFFEGEQSLGQRTMPLIRQSKNPVVAKYRENVRWEASGVSPNHHWVQVTVDPSDPNTFVGQHSKAVTRMRVPEMSWGRTNRTAAAQVNSDHRRATR